MAFGDLKAGGAFSNASTNPGTGIAATGSCSVSVGDLVVVNYVMRQAVASSFTIVDDLGHNYAIQGQAAAGSGRVQSAWVRVTTAGTLTTVTAAHTSTTADVALCVAVFEGPFDATPLDADPAEASDGLSPFDCPSTGTLAQADELVIGMFGCGNGRADDIAATSPDTLAVQKSSGTGANTAGGAICYRLVSATTAVAPQFTTPTNPTGASEGTLSFKKGVPATVYPPFLSNLQLDRRLIKPRFLRGAQIEFQTPTTLRTYGTQITISANLSATGTGIATFVGASTADSPLSATGTGTATFVGASTADSSLSATGTGAATFTGFGDAPMALSATGTGTATLVGASQADSVLSATGTGTAAFTGASQADSLLSSTGTATVSFEGTTAGAFSDAVLSATGTATVLLVGEYSFNGIAPHHNFERGAKQSLGRGPQVEFQTPLPIRALTAAFGDGALSATGTGTASFIGASTSDSNLSATGTGTATFVGASTADTSLTATGLATVSFVGASTADSILSATGTATVSFNFANSGDGALTATGTGDATFVGLADSPGALSATGTGDALFVGAADVDGTLAITGTGDASFVGAFDTAVVTPPVVESAGGAGGFPGAWGKPKRRRRKKEALDELGELLVAVSQQVAPWTKAKAYEAEQALYRDVLERGRRLDESDTLARIEAEIANVRELLAEIDDEEAMMFLLT